MKIAAVGEEKMPWQNTSNNIDGMQENNIWLGSFV